MLFSTSQIKKKPTQNCTLRKNKPVSQKDHEQFIHETYKAFTFNNITLALIYLPWIFFYESKSAEENPQTLFLNI